MENVENQNKFYTIEIVFSLLFSLIVIVGIIFEIISKNGHTIWIIGDIRNLSFVILQIQAGVSTLAVALLALISGMIGNEAYGISITQYYLRTRPKVFKQHILIIEVISLVFLGVGFELLEFYNIVFTLFFCEWFLIIVSVIEILPIFKGLRPCKKQIRNYLVHEIKHKHNLDVIIQYLESYNAGTDLDEEILWMALNCLLEENTKEAMDILNTEWCKMLSSHLSHNDSWVIKGGLNLLQETYHQIWRFILDNRDKCGLADAPHVLDILYEECRLALDHLSMEEVEECFGFVSFFEFVARVDIWYLKNDVDKYLDACRYVEWLSKYTGYLLNKKLQFSLRPLSEYDRSYWGKPLKDQYIRDYNVPDDVVDIFLLHRCRVYLGYTISLLIDGHRELFEKHYLESNSYLMIESPYGVLFRMAVACYLYYLSEVENIRLVPQKAKNCASSLLASEKFKSQFTFLLERTNWKDNINLYHTFFEKTLEELLYHYELYKDGQVKTLVIDSTVDVFSIFVQCYISDYHFLGAEFVDKTDYKRLESLIIRFLEGKHREQTKEQFRKLYKLLIFQHTGIQDKANDLFYQWEKGVLEKYKKEKINKATIVQKEFIDTNVEDILREDTKEHLVGHFQEQYGSLMDQSIVEGDELSFDLMRFISNTKYFLSEKSLHDLYTHLDGLLLYYIANYLYKENAVTIYDRSDRNDFEFLEDLEREDVDLLVGSEFEFSYKDYRNWKKFREFCDKRECIFFGGVQYALAIHQGNLKFAVYGVDVSVYDSSIDTDSDVEYNEETGLYNIRLINNIAGEFSKEEAENYIKNQKKIIDISVKVRIKVAKDNIGFLVENTFPD